jgi:hypothetical protein
MSQPCPSALDKFIQQVAQAKDALDVALQEARLVQQQPDLPTIAALEQTLSDQIDGYGRFANFHIALSFDELRDELDG